MITINTNLISVNAQRNLQSSATALSTSMQRLSSGMRVNSAKDDAAGLAIADRMTSQIGGMNVAMRNANDGISLTQTAEGALSSLTDTLQRMRDLAIQSSSNASISASDRAKLQTEFKALNDELLRVVQNTEFNGKKILNGDLASGLNIQVGATGDTSSRVRVAIADMSKLLNPVTKSTLYPKGEAIDAIYSLNVGNVVSSISADTLLKNANDAAVKANAAVVAATLAANSPTDIALAKAASTANLTAVNAIFASSTNILASSTANKTNGLLSDSFLNSVVFSNSSTLAATNVISATDTLIQAKGVTDSSQANSLLTTAKELAKTAESDVSFAGQNVYASTMSTLDTSVDAAYTRATKGSLGADKVALKALDDLDISEAIAAASYVNNPNKTQAANENAKQSFINGNKLVLEARKGADSVAADYALSAANAIDTAIAAIDTQRSNLGSMQNRFTTTLANLQNGIENQSAARSRIVDADFAQETANLSRAQILQQAGIAVLAQANQAGQNVLTLLKPF